MPTWSARIQAPRAKISEAVPFCVNRPDRASALATFAFILADVAPENIRIEEKPT